MARDRRATDHDRLLVARLDGIALRHARWGGLAEAGKAAGAAELREIGGGRADLLAEAAGTGLGFYEGQPLFEDRARAEARLLIAAGADATLIAQRAGAAQRPHGVNRNPAGASVNRFPHTGWILHCQRSGYGIPSAADTPASGGHDEQRQ